MTNSVETGPVPLPLEVPRPSVSPRRTAARPALIAALAMGGLGGWGLASVTDAGAVLRPDQTASPGAVAIPVEAPVPAEVIGLARLMPEGDLARVSPPFGAGDARIAEILIAEGDRVDAGALLATLDNRPALESALLSAEAVVAQREAALVQARENVRISLLEARAVVGEAEAEARAADARLDRARTLVARGATTSANLDDVEAAAIRAEQGLVRARAALARWDTGDVATQPDVVVAESALAAARIDVERARRDLAKAEVRAPAQGTVLEIHARVGERPGSEGILTLGRTDSMMATVEVFQTEIGRVREGQSVRLSAVPFDEALTGRVERVGLVVGRQNVVSDDTAANTDARVVEVLVRLEAQSSARAARLSNLEAIARIRTDAP
jgi:HlyD family secretion protein